MVGREHVISEARFDWLNWIAQYMMYPVTGNFPAKHDDSIDEVKMQRLCTLRKCNIIFHPKININGPNMMETLSSQFTRGRLCTIP